MSDDTCLLCTAIYNNALLKLEEEHVSGVMRHEVHVKEPEARCCSGLVDLHERLLVVNSRILRKPRVKVLHAPQAERERGGSLCSYERVKRCRFLH